MGKLHQILDDVLNEHTTKSGAVTFGKNNSRNNLGVKEFNSHKTNPYEDTLKPRQKWNKSLIQSS